MSQKDRKEVKKQVEAAKRKAIIKANKMISEAKKESKTKIAQIKSAAAEEVKKEREKVKVARNRRQKLQERLREVREKQERVREEGERAKERKSLLTQFLTRHEGFDQIIKEIKEKAEREKQKTRELERKLVKLLPNKTVSEAKKKAWIVKSIKKLLDKHNKTIHKLKNETTQKVQEANKKTETLKNQLAKLTDSQQ